jgi:tetratricopeptide (TPR) repeat protein
VSPFANLQVAHSLYFLRRYDEAIVEAHKALELDPNYAYAHRHLGRLHAAKQMIREATAACDTALRLAPDDPVVLSGCGRVYGQSGRPGDAVAVFDTLLAWSARTYVDPYFMGALATAIYANPAERNRIFEWLERALEERSPNVSYLNVEPAFDELRDDSRFHALLRQLNLPH